MDEGRINVEFSDIEREMLRAAMLEWGGPAHPTELLVKAMGFGSLSNFPEEVARLRAALQHHDPLTRQDWNRVLFAAEVVFVSDVVGSGLDWSITTGYSDVETIALIRSVQRKMPR